MPRLLIAHSHLDVLAFMPENTFRPKLFPKCLLQLPVASDQTRFKHCCFRHHVGIRGRDCLFNRAGGMTNLEADIPEQIQHLFDNLAGRLRNVATLFPM